MLAILNTSSDCAWAEELNGPPWPLLPVANRPMLDYWLELCSELKVDAVRIVLGNMAKHVEDYIDDGQRWNLSIEYEFARRGEHSADYLRSIMSRWQGGVLYFGGPFFMRRRKAYNLTGFHTLAPCCYGESENLQFLYADGPDGIGMLLDGGHDPGRGLEQIHIQPWLITGIGSYYDLNMKLVQGEFTRYTPAGFSTGDSSSVGYNVRTPPSSHLQPPILIGDNCRFGSMTTVGPNAVVANHVIVDANTELIDCLILPDTYIGRNLDIHGKIVAGNRVVSPDDGTVVKIDDSWLVAQNRPAMRTEDFVRYMILWVVALALLMVLLLPFLILYPLVRLSRIAVYDRLLFHDPRTGYITLPVLRKLRNRKSPAFSAFKAMSADRFPWLLQVMRGRLFLCGQPPLQHPEDDELIRQLPEYYPGVFCYQDYNKESDRLVDSLWYAHIRSLYEDLKILVKALLSRFLRAGR